MKTTIVMYKNGKKTRSFPFTNIEKTREDYIKRRKLTLSLKPDSILVSKGDLAIGTQNIDRVFDDVVKSLLTAWQIQTITQLDAKVRQEVVDFIENEEIEVETLSSYRNRGSAPQDFSRFAEPEDVYWDEDEEFEAKCQKVIDYIENDGPSAYFDIDDDLAEELIAAIEDYAENGSSSLWVP